jgi:hypothetical protein
MKNSLSKKVAVSTLAASMVLGSIAGLPLSSKGLSEVLGANVAQASASLPNSEISDKLNALYEQLTQEEKDAISAARDKLKNVSETNYALIEPMWTSALQGSGLAKESLIQLIAGTGVFYDPMLGDLEAARLNPVYRDTLNQLAQVAGLSLNGSSTATDIAFDDLIAFTNTLEAAVEDEMKKYEWNELVSQVINPDLTFNFTFMQSVISNATQVVIDNPALDLSKVIKGLGIDAAMLADVRANFDAEVDPSKAGQKAIAAAYVRTQVDVNLTSSNEGRSVTPSLTLLNRPISSLLLTWTSDNSKITFSEGKFNLSSDVAALTEETANVEAKIGKHLFYKGEISLTYVPAVEEPGDGDGNGGGETPGSGPGGPGGPVVPVPDDMGFFDPEDQEAIDDFIDNIAQELDGIEADLAIDDLPEELSEADLGKLENALSQAYEAVLSAIEKVSTLDLSKDIKVEGGTAKATIDEAKLTLQIEKAMANAQKLADKFTQTASKVSDKANLSVPKPEVVVTFNIKSDAKKTEIPLPKSVFDAAAKAGVNKLELKLNNLALKLDPAEFKGDTTVNVETKEKSVAASATDKPIVTDVFEIEFTSNGQALTNFNKPVDINIPLPSLNGVDPELITLVKIEDGNIIVYGGVADTKNNTLKASRSSFSTYTVIENKVTFKDTASVRTWGERPIQVVAAKGIIEGRGVEQFVPNEKVTRAEFAKMIVKAFGIENAAATESFSDVSEQDWFKPYVAAAANAGLINGRSETAFEPNATITRAEMATMAARALTKIRSYQEVANADAQLKAFNDVANVHSSLRSGIALASSLKVIEGVADKQFDPNSDSTRAQAAVVIYRLLNK